MRCAPMRSENRQPRWLMATPHLTAAGLLILGLALAGLGALLASTPLSPFDLISGTGLVATALLLRRGLAVALLLYAAVMMAALMVSVWQHGLTLGSLLPAAGMLAPIGVWLLMPWATQTPETYGRTPKVALATALAIAFAAIGAAAVRAPNQMDDNMILAALPLAPHDGA